MVSETNLEQVREVSSAGRVTLQKFAMPKVSPGGGQNQAKPGPMVAFQGDVRFEYQSGGLGRFFKKAVTGEGAKLMTATGSGELFLAQDKRKIMILELSDEQMTVNGENILAFEPGIDWDVTSRGRRATRRRPLRRGTGGDRQGRRDLRRGTRPPRHQHPHLRRPRLCHRLKRRREDEHPL